MSRSNFPNPGDTLIFSGIHPDKAEREKALKYFSVGNPYTVRKVEIFAWQHFVSFSEVPGRWNGALFDRHQTHS